MKRLLLALALPACASDLPEARSNVPRATAPAIAQTDFDQLVIGNTGFAVDLYQHVKTGTDNLFFSPHSISEALAMTLAGASGETAAQMTSALRVELPAATFQLGMDALQLALASRGSHAKSSSKPFTLHDVDALWGDKALVFEQPFLDALATDYGAGVYTPDFARDPEGARTTINGWVADATADRIQDLLAPGDITSDTRFVLTNAIYFNAAWAVPFDAASTHAASFAAPAGPVTTPFMRGTSTMGFRHTAAYDLAAIPYDGGDLALLVLQPAAGTFDAFEAALTTDSLMAIARDTIEQSVDLTLPKWSMTARMSVAKTLATLGMTDAFSPDLADFSGIDGARDIHISDVIHKAFVAVDEDGTEAAAATAVIGVGDAIEEPVPLVVDHPFIYAIRDVQTGAILFFGRMMDPTQT